MKNLENKTVIILGPPRSGTSVTTSIIKMLGINIGPNRNISLQNPTGDMEDLEFTKIISEIIEEAKEKTGKDIYYWRDTDFLVNKYSHKVLKLIEAKNNGNWGWKNPYTPVVIQHFMPHIKNPYFIFINRKESDTAKSAYNIGGISMEGALERTKKINKTLEEIKGRYPDVPKIELVFKEIIKNPEDTINDLANFLDIEINKEKILEIKKVIIPRKKIRNAKVKAFFKLCIKKIKKIFKIK